MAEVLHTHINQYTYLTNTHVEKLKSNHNFLHFHVFPMAMVVSVKLFFLPSHSFRAAKEGKSKKFFSFFFYCCSFCLRLKLGLAEILAEYKFNDKSHGIKSSTTYKQAIGESLKKSFTRNYQQQSQVCQWARTNMKRVRSFD